VERGSKVSDATTTIAIEISVAALVVSGASLGLSIVTAWLTLIRRGKLAMTKPVIVFFGFDTVPKTRAKIFLRTLLYSTAIRGQVIEAMLVRLLYDGKAQVFGFWGYGETSQLSPGSGLYVGQTGLAVNHHFVLSVHEAAYEFTPGDYRIEVRARLVGKKRPAPLSEFSVSVTKEHGAVLSRSGGVLFELDPYSNKYVGPRAR
jgi:hypothetical protein